MHTNVHESVSMPVASQEKKCPLGAITVEFVYSGQQIRVVFWC